MQAATKLGNQWTMYSNGLPVAEIIIMMIGYLLGLANLLGSFFLSDQAVDPGFTGVAV